MRYMGRDAYKDWAMILLLTLILSIVLIICGVSSYGRVDQKLLSTIPEADNSKLPFDPNALSNAIKVIDTRATNQKDIINANIPLAPL